MRNQACSVLLSLALLLTLAACGGESTRARPLEAGTQYYSALHDGVEYSDSIDAACFSGGTLYYITKKMTDSGGRLGCQLYFFDPETGTGGWCEPFRTAVRAWEKEAALSLTQITALAPGEGETLLCAAVVQPAGDDPDRPLPLYLLAYDTAAGALRWCAPLPETLDGSMITQLVCGSGGTVFGLDYLGQLFAVRSDGTLAFCTETDAGHLTRLCDGRAVLLRPLAGNAGWRLLLPDPDTGRETAFGTLPWLHEGSAADALFFPGRGDDALYLVTGTSLFALSPGEGAAEGSGTCLLSWANCGIDGTGLLAFAPTGERDFTVLSLSAALGAECARLQYSETDPDADKVTLTLACRELPPSVSRAVLRFNRESVSCRIQVLDYGPLTAGSVDRLTLDLNAGRIPDLFCADGIDLRPLIDRGLLEDLWPWIDGDDSLGRDELVLPLFAALEEDGRLFTLTDRFSLRTALALPSVAGETPGWSLAEFSAARASLEDCRSIAGLSRDRVLEDILALYLQDYVDWENKTARFDSPEFLALLEYLALFPESTPKDDDRAFWLAEGKQLFAPSDFSSLVYGRFDRIRLSGSVSTTVAKGYPGLPGNGSAFVPHTPLALSSVCADREEAWRFLRTLLLPENQSFYSTRSRGGEQGFPTNRQVFSAMLRDAESDSVPLSYQGLYGTVELPRWTPADSDAFSAWLEGITVAVHPEYALESIVRDELGRFLAGQQSAQSAAAAIQSRAELCLGERRS